MDTFIHATANEIRTYSESSSYNVSNETSTTVPPFCDVEYALLMCANLEARLNKVALKLGKKGLYMNMRIDTVEQNCNKPMTQDPPSTHKEALHLLVSLQHVSFHRCTPIAPAIGRF